MMSASVQGGVQLCCVDGVITMQRYWACAEYQPKYSLVLGSLNIGSLVVSTTLPAA